MIRRETIVAGKLISRRYYWTPERIPGVERKKRRNPTRAAVMKINQKNAERELVMKLHHNFGEGDIHAVLTYAGDPPTPEEAEKERKNFLKRLRRYHKKVGRPLKWIMTTEYEKKRVHHHLIMNYMDVADLTKLWKRGRINITLLDDSGDYRKLAHYMIKETSRTFRQADAFAKQRYSCSRTVTSPVKKVEDVRISEALRDPKPVKGYHIIKDSVYRGRNPVTGIVTMEYMLLANTPYPRLKVWRRGKVEKYHEHRYDPRRYELDGQLMLDLDQPEYWE